MLDTIKTSERFNTDILNLILEGLYKQNNPSSTLYNTPNTLPKVDLMLTYLDSLKTYFNPNILNIGNYYHPIDLKFQYLNNLLRLFTLKQNPLVVDPVPLKAKQETSVSTVLPDMDSLTEHMQLALINNDPEFMKLYEQWASYNLLLPEKQPNVLKEVETLPESLNSDYSSLVFNKDASTMPLAVQNSLLNLKLPSFIKVENGSILPNIPNKANVSDIKIPKNEEVQKPSIRARAEKFLDNNPAYQTATNTLDRSRHVIYADLAGQDSAETAFINGTYDSVANSMMAFGPIGTIVGGAMKLGAFTGDTLLALGGGTDQMTMADKILDSNLFSWNVGAINGFTGHRLRNFAINKDLEANMASGYGGTYDFLRDMSKYSGKKIGGFSGRKYNQLDRKLNLADNFLKTLASINYDNQDRLDNLKTDLNKTKYSQDINGGYDLTNSLYAKEGGSLKNHINLNTKQIDWEPTISVGEFKNGGDIKKSWEPQISYLSEGGITLEKESTVKLKNIIPEGALHKNKHHMDNDTNITKKGIPVVDNAGEQLAEIELNEIIFTLEVTLKLEDLYLKFFDSETTNKEKDNLAIEAGKLLVDEILFNTDDKTGLIKTLKEGGQLNNE